MGHTLSSAVGGIFGGSSAPADAAPVAAQENSNTNNSSWGNNCAGATQNFTKCMDDNSGNMNICGWYLEQLVSFHSCFLPGLGRAVLTWFCHLFQKACQSAASQY